MDDATNTDGLRVSGTINSAANTTFRLEFFANVSCDSSGYGEGETFLGFANVTTDASCSNSFIVTLPVSVAEGRFITATATDSAGNTSEFSPCVPVVGAPLPCSDISCLADISIPTDLGQCGAVVTYLAPATSGLCGTVLCVPPSGSFFFIGTTTVNCWTNGAVACLFTVTVQDTEFSQVICPTNIEIVVNFGQTSSVVDYSVPSASDNCAGLTIACSPLSSSVFPLGTNTVTCITADAAGHSNQCTFAVIVIAEDMPHDLAVTRLKAPRTVNLSQNKPSVTRPVSVTIQNRSSHDEMILDAQMLTALVTLEIDSLSPATCPAPAQMIISPTTFPITIQPKGSLNVIFEVTFNCANDVAKNINKNPGHEDFSYTARVHHEAIDGSADSHTADDVCPHSPLGVDSNPDGSIIDRGCGGKNPDGTFGGDVLSDVVVK